jgi:hypothetical protein
VRGYGSGVGSWYWIGASAGFGTALGVLNSGVLGLLPGGIFSRTLGSLLGGVALGLLVSSALGRPGGWGDPIAGTLGGLLGFVGSVQIVSGALRRGGTRGGIAAIVALAALVVAGIAFIPVAGYLEALALPALAARLRRTQPERYAGLRTLARG